MSTKYYGVNELRKMFLDFFESKGHLARGSYSLVPHNDNSVLLIPAGMAPLKPYFTGQEVPPNRRMATCQKCIRTGDIENVGKTARHGTFFEMLGNFSFGDYFKKESLAWTWEFLTEVVGLEPDRLYPSIYQDDDEAFEIWNKQIGIPAEKIFRFGKEDNFWEHGAGPCGPCSEVYYDRGEEYGCGKEGCTVGCDCDRYMEIWNNVFTQFNGDGKGGYEELENKNIDTGMGLERLAVVVQNVDSIFAVDTIKALLDEVARLAGVKYKDDETKDISLRLITDHIRSVTFMVSDGIMPSNEGRGYVLRRLLRRAARHGKILGIEGTFLASLSKKVIEVSKDGYPELGEKAEFIFKVIGEEENKFNKTIDQGLSILSEMENGLKPGDSLSGEDAFKLYDTYGFPLDLTKEILEEKGFGIDEKAFNECMEKQRQTARNARKTTNYMGADVTVYQSIPAEITSKFVGYDNDIYDSQITVLTTDSGIVDALADGDAGTIITDETPFYATSGGQHADSGIISNGDNMFVVSDVIKLQGGKIGHVGKVTSGMFKVGDTVSLAIDVEKRALTAKNHSATHLLQKALKMVLGNHVEQAGSDVDSNRLRFDFTHFSAMTNDEIKQVEDIVNKEIAEDLQVVTDIMDIESAKKTGAMALFGEKYGDKVRVVSMGDFSKELCGGTHVKNTGVISYFKITSETGVSAGVRRIEALTSDGLIGYFEEIENRLKKIASDKKIPVDSIEDYINKLSETVETLTKENEEFKLKLAKDSLGSVDDEIKEIKGVKALIKKLEGVESEELLNLGDELKEKLGDGVIVLFSGVGGKVNILAMATDGAINKGAHAGNLIKEVAPILGGGGGGRPNMARAGGKDFSKIGEAIAKTESVIESQIK